MEKEGHNIVDCDRLFAAITSAQSTIREVGVESIESSPPPGAAAGVLGRGGFPWPHLLSQWLLSSRQLISVWDDTLLPLHHLFDVIPIKPTADLQEVSQLLSTMITAEEIAGQYLSQHQSHYQSSIDSQIGVKEYNLQLQSVLLSASTESITRRSSGGLTEKQRDAKKAAKARFVR